MTKKIENLERERLIINKLAEQNITRLSDSELVKKARLFEDMMSKLLADNN